MNYTAKQISESRKEALIKIKTVLDKGNVEKQFEENDGGYYSKNKFLLVFKGNYNGMPSEMRIDKTDSFYGYISGNKAIYATVGLFHEKQIKGYTSIERAFIDVGMKLCANKKQKAEFFNKYAKRYNEKIKKFNK